MIPFIDVVVFLAFLVVGLVILMVLGAIIFLLPAVILTIVVWFLTGSTFWAGMVFLVIAVISLLKKR
jgi:hypothetical protein